MIVIVMAVVKHTVHKQEKYVEGDSTDLLFNTDTLNFTHTFTVLLFENNPLL